MRASKQEGPRIHIYNTPADGPEKGHEMLRRLHTCLNDQTKKRKEKRSTKEYAVAIWSKTQGTQRELPKVAGFQCTNQGISAGASTRLPMYHCLQNAERREL